MTYRAFEKEPYGHLKGVIHEISQLQAKEPGPVVISLVSRQDIEVACQMEILWARDEERDLYGEIWHGNECLPLPETRLEVVSVKSPLGS